MNGTQHVYLLNYKMGINFGIMCATMECNTITDQLDMILSPIDGYWNVKMVVKNHASRCSVGPIPGIVNQGINSFGDFCGRVRRLRVFDKESRVRFRPRFPAKVAQKVL
jgi:hypothetical protein